jgi:hypothetical protein
MINLNNSIQALGVPKKKTKTDYFSSYMAIQKVSKNIILSKKNSMNDSGYEK